MSYSSVKLFQCPGSKLSVSSKEVGIKEEQDMEQDDNIESARI